MRTTRRHALRLAASGAACLALPWRAAVAQPLGLITRTIPSTGQGLPVIGVGTARRYNVGDEIEEREPIREVLEAFPAMGGRLIDTAPTYGTAEQVCGDLVRELGNRGELFIASKVSLRGRSGRDAGIAQMQQSMRHFATDYIDLMQVHNLNDWRTQLELIKSWKDEGRLGHVGITTSFDRQYEDFENVMRQTELDTIQVDYAINNRNAEDRILPLAADRGVAVLINLPLGRSSTFRAVGNRPLPEWVAEYGIDSWAQYFLKWVVSHPAVTVAIAGMAKLEYLIDNLGAARGRMPDAAGRQRMLQYFESL